MHTQDELRAKNKPKSVDEEETITSKSRDIGRLLSAIFQTTDDRSTMEDVAADFAVLAHHPEIGEESQTSWIGLVQSLGLDPATVAFDKRDRILKLIWDAASTPPAVGDMT